MNTVTRKQRDPVCKMWVEDDLFQKDHFGMHFVFCSAQCLERFDANPHLYIGYPGEQAPVQQGQTSMKQRRLRFSEMPNTVIAAHILACLRAMMGVDSVTIEGNQLRIRYDLFQATARQIENVIEGAGGSLSQGRMARLRRALIDVFEIMELDSRELPPQHKGHHH